jgi:hypothetical protein
MDKIEAIKSIKVRVNGGRRYVNIGRCDIMECYQVSIWYDYLLKDGYLEFPLRGARIESVADYILRFFPDNEWNVFYFYVPAGVHGSVTLKVFPEDAKVFPFEVYNSLLKNWRRSKGVLVNTKSDMVAIYWSRTGRLEGPHEGITVITIDKKVYNFPGVKEFEKAFAALK